MTEYENGAEKPHGKGVEIEDRDIRALTEYHSVLPNTGRAKGANDLYLVISESGSEYLVDLREERCTCPDHRHREVECKHLRRVAFATGKKPVPCWINYDAVDPRLGEHVEQQIATDGGINESDSERPDDCRCIEWNVSGGPPCFSCYREGYKTPATSDDNDREDDTPIRDEPADFEFDKSTSV